MLYVIFILIHILLLILIFLLIGMEVSELFYVYIFDHETYKAYKSIDYNNLSYYDSWECWYDSGDYRKGLQLVNFDGDLVLYMDGTIIISSFYKNILKKVKERL